MEQLVDIVPVSKFSSYKYSGEDWMGDVPGHWEVKKLKHVLFEKKKRTNPALNAGSISFGKVVIKDDEKIPLATKASYQEVRKGEFLINPLNLNYDLISLRIALSNIDVVVSSGYIVLDTKADVNKEYLNYLLHRYDVAYMKLLGSGVRQTINFNDIADSLLILPPIEEQTRIAQFLDRKTAQIDQAIAQKEKLIELLKERRQILIHNAVTRGLNPNVKMKDSGVEWIGEVPEHWQVKRLRFIGRCQNGITKDANSFGSGFPFVTYGDVYRDSTLAQVPSGLVESTADDRELYSVKKGDVFFTRTSETIEEIGFSSVCLKTIPNATFAGFIIRFRPDDDILNINFSKFYFRSYTHRAFFVKEMNLVIRASLSQELLKKLPVLIPPLSEQIEIAASLNAEDEKITRAIYSTHLQIDKLKEYKATLINSAVTGKIKV